MEGWVKLWRKFLQWEWSDMPEMVSLYIHLLLMANPDNTSWHGVVVEKGQLITSIASLKKATGLSTQQVRTCLERLKSTNEITIKSTNKYTIITICKYESYQANANENNKQNNKLANKQTTNKQQTNNKQITTDREYKEDRELKEDKKIEREDAAEAASPKQKMLTRRDKFISEVGMYMGTYGENMLNAFVSYWTEPNRSMTKMRYEMEKTWDTARRLATWASREKTAPQAQSGNSKLSPTEAWRRMVEKLHNSNTQTTIEL